MYMYSFNYMMLSRRKGWNKKILIIQRSWWQMGYYFLGSPWAFWNIRYHHCLFYLFFHFVWTVSSFNQLYNSLYGTLLNILRTTIGRDVWWGVLLHKYYTISFFIYFTHLKCFIKLLLCYYIVSQNDSITKSSADAPL